LLVRHAVLAFFTALDCIRRASARHILVLDDLGPAEKGYQLVELLTFPRLRAGIVALGALKLHTKEYAAGGGRDFDRIAVKRGQKVHRGRLVVDPRGGYQCSNHFIPRSISSKLLNEPLIEK